MPPAVRPIPERTEPSPAREIAPLAPPAPRLAASLGALPRLAAVLRTFLRPPQAVPAPQPRASVEVPRDVDAPPGRANIDRGVQDIRRADPGFDPSRFTGYAGMVFRDTQRAWTARDFGTVRDRVTAEMHGALQAQCDRLRSSGRVNRIGEIEITAAVTEAWQEGGRDYVTAHISGSMMDYTVDEARDSLVSGSRTIPRAVEEFWTFARPAGLNFWMLSAIQT